MAQDRYVGRDMPILILLLALGVLQYGWVLWPQLGFWWGAIDATVIVGIVVTGLMIRKN